MPLIRFCVTLAGSSSARQLSKKPKIRGQSHQDSPNFRPSAARLPPANVSYIRRRSRPEIDP